MNLTKERADIIESVSNYFKSSQWEKVMHYLKDEKEEVYHIHNYIQTKIHPLSLEEVIKGYFAKIGYPVERKIEIFTSGQVLNSGSIHGIEPKGLPHFDFLWSYSPDQILAPADKENNVEYWGESYMENFHSQFDLKTSLTDTEQRELEAYFNTDAWKDYCRLNEDANVVHIHANVETSVHPELIKKEALKMMKKQGWVIEEAVPVAFKMRGQMHGKIVFLGSTPEKIFDIAWSYNPTVTLIPSTKYWLTTDNPTYDARTMEELPLLLKRDPYMMLSVQEIEEIIDNI